MHIREATMHVLVEKGLVAALEEMAKAGEILVPVMEEPLHRGARVFDRDGDLWERGDVGWGVGSSSERKRTWEEVLHYGPLVRAS